ncbi:gap junction beta-3 protein [Myripristis murdjan]|uniref:Gap junction protein zeta 1 n=1 Tax=Myripristis murdjan TaxID=586833 RepID=A0A667YZ48_9TELE|nr:gap junction beta-3 protein-like [Myripristis murdjan]
MAAIVTGLIPILRTAVDSTTTYKCRTLWFGFLCIRLVILFLAELPWFKLDADFSCNATSDICTRACFNEHFHKPVMVAWNFLFVLVILSVLLMELFVSHMRSLARKRSSKMKANVELEAQGNGGAQAGCADPDGNMVVDLHKNKSAVGFYLLSNVLRVLVEVWFVYVLLFWNLPTLDQRPFQCRTEICTKLHICLVRAAPEKRMSIYALASISAMVIVCSVLFCMYSIAHYLFGI